MTPQVALAVEALRSKVAAAVTGGADPADDPEVPSLCRLVATIPFPEADKRDALVRSLQDKTAFPSVGRRVLLARAQRFLLVLSSWLHERGIVAPADAAGAPAPAHRAAPRSALTELDGVGPVTAGRLEAAGFTSPRDILYCLPTRYEDRRTAVPIADLQAGTRAVVCGAVVTVRLFGPRWKQGLEVVVDDGTGRLSARWFSRKRPGTDRFPAGCRVFLAGPVQWQRGRWSMAHPTVWSPEDTGRARIAPVYPDVPGVPRATWHKAVASALDALDRWIADPLPDAVLRHRNLPPLSGALAAIHRPEPDLDAEAVAALAERRSQAHRRLAYDEFLLLQLALLERGATRSTGAAPTCDRAPEVIPAVFAALGFAPTPGQRRAADEIAADLAATRPMRRLLQGDVGSGKTAVALCALAGAARSGVQAALMAPTEVLAEQHVRTAAPVLEALGLRCALLLGAMRPSARKRLLQQVAAGEVDVLIGTHALFSDDVVFPRLGLAVVDEQHRFGVAQRLALARKGHRDRAVHLLVMTATPIPRSLALTVYGDLDISAIADLPPGRRPVETAVCVGRQERDAAYAAVARAVAAGEQAYVVCPAIDSAVQETTAEVEAVAARLRDALGGDRVAVLHGRLSADQRDAAMAAFLAKEAGVLVATTVIEVGVDVADATVMLVENAERFGLAQLHQLRGRVGRSDKQARCYLCTASTAGPAVERLQILARTHSGFDIAQADLELRGPGELYGTRQAGLPGFTFGNLVRDTDLIAAAREDARELATGVYRGRPVDTDALRAALQRHMAAAPLTGEEAG